MREVTVFIGTNKVGLDYIENLRDQILELFVLAKEDEKEDIYYKYNSETGEFLEYMFHKFEIFPSSSESLNIKGPILFVENINDKNKSVDSFLEENKRRYLLEYLEQLQSSKNEDFIREAKKKTESVLNKYKEMIANLEAEIDKFETFLANQNFFEDKKEALMYDVKKLNFSGLKDKFMLFFKGVTGGKNKKNYEAMISSKVCEASKCEDEKVCDTTTDTKTCDTSKESCDDKEICTKEQNDTNKTTTNNTESKENKE